jgi:hypothetical protein
MGHADDFATRQAHDGWETRGKTIAQLIQELRTFDNQGWEVRISTDDGLTTHPISLVGHQDGACVLTRVLYDQPRRRWWQVWR